MWNVILAFIFGAMGAFLGFVIAVAIYVYTVEHTSIQMPRDELSVPGVLLSLIIIACGALGAYVGWQL